MIIYKRSVYTHSVCAQRVVHGELRHCSTRWKQQGFALITALWAAALLSVLGAALIGHSLNTSNSIAAYSIRLQAEQLHNAALKAAVFDIVQPRETVAVSGVPRANYVYQNRIAPVRVSVTNEAAYLDLTRVDHSLLSSIFSALSIDATLLTDLKDRITQHEGHFKPTFASLRRRFANNEREFARLTRYITFYNGSETVNPLIAREELLAALPQLNQSDVAALINARSNTTISASLSSSVDHPMLSHRASNHYRITTTIQMGDQTFSKTQIIKISLDQAPFYRVVAEL